VSVQSVTNAARRWAVLCPGFASTCNTFGSRGGLPWVVLLVAMVYSSKSAFMLLYASHSAVPAPQRCP
jgi:hypothetical protein